ncbi:MAG: hypothetical protein U1A78_08555 [Polyangia bacterium]
MRTLPYGFPLLDLIHELTFTSAQLEAHALSVSFAKPFADLTTEVHRAVARQFELVAAQARTEAKKVQADGVLNRLVDQSRAALLTLSDNNRDTPLYKRLFGDQRPSTIKRPVLGEQLERMRGWVAPLQTATQPELTALAPLLTTAIKAADDAVTAGRTAEQQLTDFLEIGDCKALVDRANALRKATFGKLAELVHSKPEAHLPADFAEPFFLQESRWSAPGRDELLARIARNDRQNERMRQQIKELEEQAAIAEKNERAAQADAVRAELAAATKRRAEEQAREAALKDQLDQLVSPSPAPGPAPA